MARFVPKVHERRYLRRTGNARLLEKGISEYSEVRDLQPTTVQARQSLPKDKRAELSAQRKAKRAEAARIREELSAVVRRTNTKALNSPFSNLTPEEVLSATELAAMRMEKETAIRDKRAANIVLDILTSTPKQILMLLLKEQGQSIAEITSAFNHATGNIWMPENQDRQIAKMMGSLCAAGFARVSGKSRNSLLYSITSAGSDYGQAIAYMALYTDKVSGIHMTGFWGSTHASPQGIVTAVNRFKMLERLERGDARINELAELLEPPGFIRRDNTRHQINGLDKLGLIRYIFSAEDLLLLLPQKAIRSGKFDNLSKKLAEQNVDKLTSHEQGRLRISLTEDGREKLGNLLATARAAIRNASVDPRLRSIAKNCAGQSLGLIAVSAMRGHMAFHSISEVQSPRPPVNSAPLSERSAASVLAFLRA
jgi:DNA-binding PadR family transcriptional regulator